MAGRYDGLINTSKTLREVMVNTKNLDRGEMDSRREVVEKSRNNTVEAVTETYRTTPEYLGRLTDRVSEVLEERGHANWYDNWVVGEDNGEVWKDVSAALVKDEKFLSMTSMLDIESRQMLVYPLSWILTANRFLDETKLDSNKNSDTTNRELVGSEPWEIEYKGVKIGVYVGDIVQAPVSAIACPTDPWLELGGGRVEGRINAVTDGKLFEGENRKVLDMMGLVMVNDGDEAIENARKLMEYFSGGKKDFSEDEIRGVVENIKQTIEVEGGDIVGHLRVFYGAAVPVKAGEKLARNGIDTVVMLNVTPHGRSMKSDDMVMFTGNCIAAAELAGAPSIAVPAIGTGFAASENFGMTLPKSMAGFFEGARRWVDKNSEASVKKIVFNLYKAPEGVGVDELEDLWRMRPQLSSGNQKS